MNVSFFVTCIGDALESRMARGSVLLLEKLSCHANFPGKQGCCNQPAVNSGYIKETIPGMKSLIAALEDGGDPIISPAGSCTYAVKNYPTCLADEPEQTSRAKKVVARMQDLTSFIVNKLGVVDIGANLQGRVVCHPSCSLIRELGVKDEPLTLLKNVCGLELLTFAGQDTCCGFGGTFSIKTAEIPNKMVREKVVYLMEVHPEYLIGANVNYLLNVSGRLQREGQKAEMMHVTEVLMNR